MAYVIKLEGLAVGRPSEYDGEYLWFMTFSNRPNATVHMAADGHAHTDCGIWANGTKHDPTTFGDVARRLCPQCVEAWRVLLTVVAKPNSRLGSEARQIARRSRAKARARRK